MKSIPSKLSIALLAAALVFPCRAQTDVEHMSSSGRDIKKIEIASGIYQFMTMRDAYVRQLNSVVS